MNLRSVDLNLLTVFDAIMAEQNLSRAANRIGMSQPAMSNALARLRVVMRDELFKNTGRGVKPTPQAIALAEPIHSVLENIARTLSQIEGFDFTSSNRKFVLSSADYGVSVILPSLLERLNKMGASVSIDIEQHDRDELKEKLNFCTVDLALEYEPINASGLENRVIMPEGVSCVFSKNHRLSGDKLTLEDYCSARHLATDQSLQFEQHLIKHDIHRNIVMRVPNYFNIPCIIPSTDLVSTLPQRLAETFAKQFDLNVVPCPIPKWDVPVFLLWHQNQAHDPGHRWLREIIIDVCNDM